MGSKSRQPKHQNIPALRARWINVYELMHLIMHLLVDAKKSRKEINIIGGAKAAKLEGIIIGLMAMKDFIEQRSFLGDCVPITAPTGGATDGTESESKIIGTSGEILGRTSITGESGKEIRDIQDQSRNEKDGTSGGCSETIPPVSDAPGRVSEKEEPRG